MTRENATDAGSAAAEAARLFVRVDTGQRGADIELAKWIDEQPENERALERVELAAALGRRLAVDPRSALHAEAARVAALGPRRRLWGHALALGGALAAALLVAALVVSDFAPPSEPEPAKLRAAELVAVDAPSNPVSVLPSGAVVDASAVAVLPFTTAGDPDLAQGLERDVVDALRTVPGLYVIADAAVASYAGTDLSPFELGTQLGARGIVDAEIELVGGRVRVNARLRDTATGATLWRSDLDKPVDELRAVRYEIADSIAATMLDSSLRDPVARSDRSSAPFYSSKPFPQ